MEKALLGKTVEKNEHTLIGVFNKPRAGVELVAAAVEEIVVLVKEREAGFWRLAGDVAKVCCLFEDLGETGKFVELRKVTDGRRQ